MRAGMEEKFVGKQVLYSGVVSTLLVHDWAEWVAVDGDGYMFEYDSKPVECRTIRQWYTEGWSELIGNVNNLKLDDSVPELHWIKTRRKLRDVSR